MEEKKNRNSSIIHKDKKFISTKSHHKLRTDSTDSMIPGSTARLGKKTSDSAVAIPISPISHHRHINPDSSLDILVAEDSELSYLIVKVILDKLHANIHHARNGVEVMEIIRSSHIDLILMDINMPLLNGIETTQEIRKIIPEMPVIALSTFHDNSDILSSFQAGCDDFISKPIDSNLLLSKIMFWSF
jgi:two-component system, cell cycle response regulator DivK